ncbi:hypothetical protein [Magnetospirillum fulvum]|uniref:Uncharacterized protein n=1 Tax=Magnetospirillum fulvum TaxID=1082 RepID=A0A1H6GZY1_MAGFU|nr:hypothetical protein [Magnetospirillum fulvum]SEH28472.1 hypothetical protein SAMN04244559_00709 [Magnetospirillum fulvum]
MSFEYGQRDGRLTLPNPLKTHNYFLAAASASLFLGAMVLLFDLRSELQTGARPYAALALAVVMLGASIRYLYTCLSQLRFYFGRGRPVGLAPVLTDDSFGTSYEADKVVKETMRQQAIEYPEPVGPISTLLHSIVPNLIYAPLPLRRFAEWQFKGMITLFVLLIGLGATLLLGAPGQTSKGLLDWIGLAFVIIGAWTLVRPSDAALSAPNPSLLSVRWMTLLVAFSVVGPVILSFLGPTLPKPFFVDPYPHVFILLSLGLAAHALFFFAIVGQLLPPPPTATKMIQDTWNISNSPALVIGEFMRAMQESWPDKIPNRRYIRIDPVIDLTAETGSFKGEIMEETQPFPIRLSEEATQVHPSGVPALILALDAVGVAFVLAATVASVQIGSGLAHQLGFPSTAALYALFCWALGSFALEAARHLLLRFDFKSLVHWLELSGIYVSGRVDQGNVISGTLRSTSSVVQVESMTFRLWSAQLHTVAFGKDAPRHIVAMAGAPDEAEALAARLKAFATNQAVVTNLSNAANAERIYGNSTLAANAAQAGASALGAPELNAALQVSSVVAEGESVPRV